MKNVLQIALEDDAKAWGILVRHSPGIALPNRVVIISDEAVKALREAGVRFAELKPPETPPGTRGLWRVKEYDLFIPLSYNDGSAIESEKLVRVRDRLLQEFGDLTFFPQPNLGFWKQGFLTFEDHVVIYKIVTKDARRARRFFRQFKDELKRELQQAEIFLLEKDVNVL